MEIQRLRDLREDHDKAQWEVAAYLNMHRSVYRRYENGTRETPAWVLDKLADYYDEEVEMEVQSLMAAMEPMIIIVLAVVVGGLIAACMMPMMSMYEALDAM